jgi:hypothetical protein
MLICHGTSGFNFTCNTLHHCYHATKYFEYSTLSASIVLLDTSRIKKIFLIKCTCLIWFPV